MSDSDFKALVARSHHIGGVLNAFGLENVGRNHHTARERIHHLGVNTAHFDPKKRTWRQGQPLSQVLVEEGSLGPTHLKRRLLKAGVLIEVCVLCGQGPFWQGIKLMLVLDHINGKRRDNRLENLRLLCPNCNSQQPTFSGRHNRKQGSSPSAGTKTSSG